MMSAAAGASPGLGKTDVRYSANTIEEMQKLLLGYRDNMRVEVETGVAILQKPWLNFARSRLGRTAWS